MNQKVRSIHNLQSLFWFRGMVFVLLGGGAAPMFFLRSDSTLMYGTLVGSFVLILVLWNIFKPGYTAVEIVNDHVLISTDKEEKHEFYLKFPGSELAYYEILPVYGGLHHTLYFFRQAPQGLLRSKKVPLSFFGPSKIAALRRMLDELLVQHHRQPVTTNAVPSNSLPNK
jgi:hypothetical protein